MPQSILSPKEETVRLTVDLPKSLHRELSKIAAQLGRTKSEVVRVIIDDYVKKS